MDGGSTDAPASLVADGGALARWDDARPLGGRAFPLRASKRQSLAVQVAVLVVITAFFTKIIDVGVVLLLPPAPVGITLQQAVSQAQPLLRSLDGPVTQAVVSKVAKAGDAALDFSLAAQLPPVIAAPVYRAFVVAAAEQLRIDPSRIQVVRYDRPWRLRLPPPPGDRALGAHGKSIVVKGDLVSRSTAGELILMPAPLGLAIRTRAGWLVMQDAQRGELYWLRHSAPTVLLTFAILAPMVIWRSRRIADHIKSFAAAAETFGGKPNAPPLDEPTIVELGPAVRAFNAMNAKIKTLNANRDMMMAAVSHDIRTPLARMRFRIAGLEPSVRDGIARDIIQIDKFIDELLALTRNAPSAASQSAFDLSALVQSAVDELSDSGADVVFDGPASLPIHADLPAVRRIINNLLDNALKYGTRAWVRLGARDGRAEILVEDDGPGIAKADRAVIFEPFQRLEPSRNRSTGGSGLGLAIARHLARMQRGDVELQPAVEGQGARFVFWLPDAPPPPPRL